ncbi:AbiJ-NTD4 domain-containing protein [Pseudomonas sp. NFACC05-1]|uniref:AbiJ-NTD4 domain-containing protein n=1 Tax=Pseudomonas sp. NFACC05-1 TaxID=1566241 RepID=UPI0008719070|nr:hypothetical protein [Pseudomonas sp. NFACC05-1]SCW97661.1 hypothetical protein SAMN03159424_05764 [Pseudomonas sp. NFACC05-1]
MENYFSNREHGPKPRTETEITPQVWGGIIAVVRGLVNSGAFGSSFPVCCYDGPAVIGTDEVSFGAAVKSHMPGLGWPLQASIPGEHSWMEAEPYAPPYLLVLDFLEFLWFHVAKPILGLHHNHFQHHHLTFDESVGRIELRDQINLIFARNGVAYELNPHGQIVRLLPVIISDALLQPMLRTGDQTLDVMLEEARIKFSAPDPLKRREALERLWDCFERIKSLAHASDKKKSIQIILEQTAPDIPFRSVLDTEASQLTLIGNGYLIRHHELKQIPVVDVDHVDYLFHRMFALIQLLVRKNAPRQKP